MIKRPNFKPKKHVLKSNQKGFVLFLKQNIYEEHFFNTAALTGTLIENTFRSNAEGHK